MSAKRRADGDRARVRSGIAPLPPRPLGDGAVPAFGMLAEVGLPADVAAPGAARMLIAHCMTGLVGRRVVTDAQLLASELVTNSLRHGGLRDDDPVVVRVSLSAEALRLEVENAGTVGVVAAKPPDSQSSGGFGLALVEALAARWGVRRALSTIVWFDMTRA
jgi:anti-sigma regulatory factor (Ser/Thr protein kinase)